MIESSPRRPLCYESLCYEFKSVALFGVGTEFDTCRHN